MPLSITLHIKRQKNRESRTNKCTSTRALLHPQISARELSMQYGSRTTFGLNYCETLTAKPLYRHCRRGSSRVALQQRRAWRCYNLTQILMQDMFRKFKCFTFSVSLDPKTPAPNSRMAKCQHAVRSPPPWNKSHTALTRSKRQGHRSRDARNQAIHLDIKRDNTRR